MLLLKMHNSENEWGTEGDLYVNLDLWNELNLMQYYRAKYNQSIT